MPNGRLLRTAILPWVSLHGQVVVGMNRHDPLGTIWKTLEPHAGLSGSRRPAGRLLSCEGAPCVALGRLFGVCWDATRGRSGLP